jgi:nucleoside-diphosphate-sugar epimerase
MRRLIVGCGYLGKRVAARWLAGGDSVFALTRSPENAAGLQAQGISPVLGDVMRPETLAALPEVDTVLWAVGWDRSSGISQRDVYVNGLRNLLHQVTRRASRLIYISSTSVYGQTDGEWIDETSATNPSQPNGQACLEAENSLEPWRPGGGESPVATILRLSGIYGPGRLLSKAATLRNSEPLAGNPDAWLNLIHVEDAAEAVVTCAAHDIPSPLFLISDNEPVPRRVYYSALAELVGAPPPRFAEDDASQASSTGGTRTVGMNKRCRNTFARRLLQWTPRYPTYREGLAQAVRETNC